MHPTTSLAATCVAAVLGVMTGPGTALGQDPPDDSVRVLGAITVDVRRPGLTPGGSSAVVVDVDSLENAPGPSMEDVVRSLPLVEVRTNSRGEAQPSLRGSQDRQIAIVMDGVPLTLGWDHRTDMSVIPLTAARSVTLVRGLSSVLYGPNTLGGVLEIDVARASPRARRVDPLTLGVSMDHNGGTNLSLSAGRAFDTGGNAWVVRGGGGFEDVASVPLVDGIEADPSLRPAFLARQGERLNSDVRRTDGFLLATVQGAEGAWASLSTSATDVERGVPPEAHLDDPRFWRYPRQRRLIAALAGGTGRRETGIGMGSLEASGGLDMGSTRIEQFDSETFDDVTETEDSDDRVLSVRLVGEHSIASRGNLGVALTFADVSHDEVLDSGPARSYRQRLWSAGAESSWVLGSARRTTLAAGAAIDGANTPDAGGQAPRGSITDYGLRLGATSLIARGLQVHAAVSRRARFPSLRELYSGALGRFEPNPTLGPERLLGIEAGFTSLSRVGEVQIVGFHQALDGGIVRASVIGSDGMPRFQRVNRAEVRSRGIELFTVGEFRGMRVTADLTLQRVEAFDPSGSEVPVEYEPSVRGRARVEVPLVVAVRGSAEVRFEADQSCQNPEVGGPQKLPASASVDLTTRRRFDLGGGPLGSLEASASVWNVTDAAVFDQCGLPQPGRLFQLQLRVW